MVYQRINDNDDTFQNIVMDLMSSVMLRIATVFRDELIAFLQKQPEANIQALTDVLIREHVCSSQQDARLVIIPVLVQSKILQPSDDDDVQPRGQIAGKRRGRKVTDYFSPSAQ